MKRLLSFFKPFIILFVLVFLGIITTSCKNSKQAFADEKISFSHRTHIDKYNINDCGTCHKYDANKTFRGLPTVGECTVCHKRDGELTGTDHLTPRKKTMFDSYTDKDKPWISRPEKSEFVYYSHKVIWTTTLADGKTTLKCEACHGDKASSTGTAKTNGEKLMGQCIECHTSFNMNNQCEVCHTNNRITK